MHAGRFQFYEVQEQAKVIGDHRNQNSDWEHKKISDVPKILCIQIKEVSLKCLFMVDKKKIVDP